MRAQVKRKMNALIAAIMAAIFAFSLSGVPASALADENAEGTTDTTSNISIQGVHFMQPSAEGWEVLKVNGLQEGQSIYVTVYRDGTELSLPMKFPDAATSNKIYGQGENVAQIVAIQPENTADKTAKSQLDPQIPTTKRPVFNVEVTSAMMEGETLYFGTIYPVYGDILDENGKLTETVFMGICTADSMDIKRNMGVGQSYYKQVEGKKLPQTYSLVTSNGIDNKFDYDRKAFVVTYKQNPETAVEGTINYVNANTGEVVKTETIAGITEAGKTATIAKSFSAVTKEGDKEVTKSYRVISNLGGETVPLSYTNPSYTVQVLPLPENTTYPVTINYMDVNDNLLWSDEVDVKGEGYRYTLPNTFSMNKGSNVDAADGVNLYTLVSVEGGQVVNGAPSTDKEDTLTTQVEGTKKVPTANASTDNGTIINLTNKLTDADFVLDKNGNRVINAYYQNQDAEKKVEFTLVEMDGETGTELNTITATVDPDHVFNYTPEKKIINGKTYVPWAGNTENITYSWESLGQSVDLLQYVYYVPESYVPGNAYGVTVQYVNIANGSVLRTETEMIDPEITNWVEITGPRTFMQDGEEYVRLAGQDTAIRHAFLSPNRVYTIYYRNVNDTINANTIIDRVQIIQTTLPGTGGGLTAAPTAVDDAGDGPAVDAGVGAGDGTVVINDDDNPLANLDGQSTTDERTIAENENPLYSGSGLNGFAVAGLAIGAIALIGIVVYFLLRRRKKANDKQSA